MSVLPKDVIQVIAQQSGIPSLDDEIARRIALDVEFRVRDILADAMKRTRASKRGVLVAADVSSALRAKHVEPLTTPDFCGRVGSTTADGANGRSGYGFASAGRGLYYLEDPIVALSSALRVRMPPASVAKVTVASHWLAIDGVQPRIPQNPSVLAAAGGVRGDGGSGKDERVQNTPARPRRRAQSVSANMGSTVQQQQQQVSGTGAGTGGVNGNIVQSGNEDRIVVRARVGDVLPMEHRLWFDAVVRALEATLEKSGKEAEDARVAALHAVATAQGSGPALPYLVRYIVKTVHEALAAPTGAQTTTDRIERTVKLGLAIALTRAVCVNENMAAELHLHQLLPAVLSIVLASSVPSMPLRHEAAQVVGYITKRFGGLYDALVGRVVATFVKTLKDSKGPANGEDSSVREGPVVGALTGLRELGPTAVYAVLLSPQDEVRIDDLEEKWRSSDNVLWAIKGCVAIYAAAVEEGSGLAWTQVPDHTREALRRLVGVSID